MCDVTLDNSVDLKVEELKKKGLEIRAGIQHRKRQLYELRHENQKLVDVMIESRYILFL